MVADTASAWRTARVIGVTLSTAWPRAARAPVFRAEPVIACLPLSDA
jgi:hypothetical protein